MQDIGGWWLAGASSLPILDYYLRSLRSEVSSLYCTGTPRLVKVKFSWIFAFSRFLNNMILGFKKNCHVQAVPNWWSTEEHFMIRNLLKQQKVQKNENSLKKYFVLHLKLSRYTFRPYWTHVAQHDQLGQPIRGQFFWRGKSSNYFERLFKISHL